jgi:hypothetical protein
MFVLVLVILVSVSGCSFTKSNNSNNSQITKALTSMDFALQSSPCKSFFPNTKCDLYELQKDGKPSQRVYVNDDGSLVYFMFFNPSKLAIDDQIKTRDALLSQLYGKTVVDKIADLTNNFCPPNKNVSCYTYGNVDKYYINFRLDTPYPLGTEQNPPNWKPDFAYYEIYIGPPGEGCKWC